MSTFPGADATLLPQGTARQSDRAHRDAESRAANRVETSEITELGGTHTSILSCFSVAATRSDDLPPVQLGRGAARSRGHGGERRAGDSSRRTNRGVARNVAAGPPRRVTQLAVAAGPGPISCIGSSTR